MKVNETLLKKGITALTLLIAILTLVSFIRLEEFNEIRKSHPSSSLSEDLIHIYKNKGDYPNYSLISAHRGYWRNFPENSKEAYDAAVTIGADIIEFDVRLTKDRIPVVMHDACLNRTTTGTGLLKDYDLDEVQEFNKVNINNGVETNLKILTLREALNYMKGKALFALDIKGEDYEYAFIESIRIAKEVGALSELIIKGNKVGVTMDNLMAQANVSYSDLMYTPVLYPYKGATTSRNPNFQRNLIAIKQMADDGKIHGVELFYKKDSDPLLVEGHLEELANKNLWIGQYSFWPEECDGVHGEKNPLTDCYPVVRKYNFVNGSNGDGWNGENWDFFMDDGRGDWDWLLSNGADYIITDRPHLMVNYLEALGKRSL